MVAYSRIAEESKLSLVDGRVVDRSSSRTLAASPGCGAKVATLVRKLDHWNARAFPESRKIKVELIIVAGLYYVDMLLDGRALVKFTQQGKYNYVASIAGSIVVNAVVTAYTASNAAVQDESVSAGKYSIFGPFVVVYRAVTMKATHAEGYQAAHWGSITKSHKNMKFLRDLLTELQHLTGHEATIEAPVNTLIQFMAALEMHRDGDEVTNDELLLWLSVLVGMLSMVKNFVAWERYGRVHMRHEGFDYVIGGGESSLSIGLFRFVEISSRLCTIVVAYDVAIDVFEPWWMHYIIIAYLALVSFVLFGIGLTSLPRTAQHLALCIPGAFLFPGPLVQQPCRAKVACTSAATHYTIRIMETIALVALQGYLLDMDLDILDCANVILASVFVLSALVLMACSCCSDGRKVKECLAVQLLKRDDNRVNKWEDATPFKWPENEHVKAALTQHGFQQPLAAVSEKSQDKAVFVKGEDFESVDIFERKLQDLSPATEDISFHNCDCFGDDEMAKCLQRALPKFKKAKRVDLVWSSLMHNEQLLPTLQCLSPTLEELGLARCVDQKHVKGLQEILPKFANAKKADLSNMSYKLTEEQVKETVQSLSPTVEDLSLKSCSLSGGKVKGVWQVLRRFTNLKKMNLAENKAEVGFDDDVVEDFSQTDWKGTLESLPPTVEELSLEHCFRSELYRADREDERAKGVQQALPKLRNLKKINLSTNSGLSAEGLKATVQSVPATVEEISLDYVSESLKGSVSEQKVKGVQEALHKFIALRKVDLSNNKYTAENIRATMQSLSTTVEEASFFRCDLDDEKAGALAESMSRFPRMKRMDCGGNREITTMTKAAIVAESMQSSQGSFTWIFDKVAADEEMGSPDALEMLHASELKINPSRHSTLVDNEFTWLKALAVEKVKIEGRPSADQLRTILSNLIAGTEKEFIFSDIDLNDVKAMCLQELLPKFIAVRKVDFSLNPHLSAEGYKALLQDLSPAMEDFSFCKCTLDDRKARGLQDVLPNFADVKKVDFTDNPDLSAEGLNATLQSLSSTLEELILLRCKLDDEKAEALQQILPKFANLKTVSFGGELLKNSLTARGWKLLLRSLNPAIEDFDFDSDCVTMDTLEGFQSTLPRFKVVKKVNLRRNMMLSPNARLDLLESLSPTVEDLNLTECSMKGDQSKALEMAFPRFKNLRRMNLSNNYDIDAIGLNRIMQSISPTMEEFRIAYFKLDEEKATVLQKTFPKFTNMKKVDFSWNGGRWGDGLPAQVWKAMVQSLSHTVEVLSFADCGLDDERAKCLQEVLPQFPFLKMIDVKENTKLSIAAIKGLLESSSHTLEEFVVSLGKEGLDLPVAFPHIKIGIGEGYSFKAGD